jgi:hypothetical protein
MARDYPVACDLATLVIFDPGATLDLINTADGPTRAALDGAVARGSLVTYVHGKGPANIRLFVDEPIDPELERRGTRATTGLLRVPTGRLITSGVDQLSAPPFGGAARSGGAGPVDELGPVGAAAAGAVTAETFRPITATESVIPAGNYAVTAYEIAWGNEPDMAGAAAAYAASPLGARLEAVLEPITGVLVLGTTGGFLCALGALLFGDTTLAELVRLFVQVVPWLAVAWFGVLALWLVSPARLASAARQAAYASFPSAVVHLHRLADTASIDGLVGCAFGGGSIAPFPLATVVKS